MCYLNIFILRLIYYIYAFFSVIIKVFLTATQLHVFQKYKDINANLMYSFRLVKHDSLFT